MKILVDADSCPLRAREIIIRSARRLRIQAVFAANRKIPGIDGHGVIMEICGPAEGAADMRIEELAKSGDLVISRDIPLAQKLINSGIAVINDRGREYTRNNIGEMLSLRNWTVQLADNGLDFERISQYGKTEIKNFAGCLDRVLTKLSKISVQDTDSASA